MLEQLPDAIGHALRPLRAGLDGIAFRRFDLRQGTAAITVQSLAFADHAPLPVRYTADGEGLSPPLSWSGVPASADSLVLLVEDADAPAPHPLVHAIVVDLPSEDGAIAEGAIAGPGHDGVGFHTGRNAVLEARWLPPDPPPGHGVHRYAFQVFALSGLPDGMSESPGHDEVLHAIERCAIASGCLIGTYERQDGRIPERRATTTAAVASDAGSDAAPAPGLAPA